MYIKRLGIDTMKFSLCIPMYNEAGIIAATAQSLSHYMAAHFENYEILFANDGSTDASAAIVEALALPNVRVVGYEVNRGKGAALRSAMLAAKGDIVMFTDSDLAYGTDVIGGIAEMFGKNPDADAVVGSRNLSKDGYEGYTFLRKLASKAYIRVLCLVGGLKLSDSQCGCKAFRGEAAKKIFSHCEVDGFAFDFEAIMIGTKCGMKFLEMPVKVVNHRESKVSLIKDAFRMLRELVKMKKRIKKLDIQ